MLKLPECHGEASPETPDSYHEYECYAPAQDKVGEDVDFDCDTCLANFLQCGGTIHPETGKKMPYLLARLLYGRPSFYIPSWQEAEDMKIKDLLEHAFNKENRK
jgi:hypothetical protein